MGDDRLQGAVGQRRHDLELVGDDGIGQRVEVEPPQIR
jgi:hypothetical protein